MIARIPVTLSVLDPVEPLANFFDVGKILKTSYG